MTTTKPSIPAYKRGDIVLVLFPNSDLQTAKRRPALVIQADNLQTELSQVIVAMITSKQFRAKHPSRVLISLTEPAGKESGLLMDSVIMTDNLSTIVEMAINKVIGYVPMQHVDDALKHTLGLE